MPLSYPVAILPKTTNTFTNTGANNITLNVQAGNASYYGVIAALGSTGVGATILGSNSVSALIYSSAAFEVTPSSNDSASGRLILGNGSCVLTSGDYSSGATNHLDVKTGDSSVDYTGNLTLSTGNAATYSGNIGILTSAGGLSSGAISISTGTSSGGQTGNISLVTGNSDVAYAGNIYLTGGDSAFGATYNGGSVIITGGTGDLAGDISLTGGVSYGTIGGTINLTAGSGYDGGNINLTAGSNSGGTDGYIYMYSYQGGLLQITNVVSINDLSVTSSLSVSPQTIAFGGGTITFPSVTDTVAVLGTAQTYTSNRRFNNNVGFSTETFGTNNRLLVNAYNAVNNNAIVQFSSTSATFIPLVLQGASSQSGNLLELQNNSGTMLTRFKADGSLEVAGGGGTTSTASIKILNTSSYNPIIQWVPVGANTGLRFYSNTSEIARFQDNGACYFASMGTTSGGLNIADYYLQRGSSSQKMSLLDSGQPGFDFAGNSATSFSTMIQATSNAAGMVVAILKAHASQSANILEAQNSSGTAGARINSNRDFSRPNGTNSEQFGASAVASGSSAVAIGYQATASVAQGTAIGYQAQALITGGEEWGTAIGYQSTAYGKSVAIGTSSNASATGGTAIGVQAAAGNLAVGIGVQASATNIGAVAIGYAASVSTVNTVAIGRQVTTSGGIGLGYNIPACAAGEFAINPSSNGGVGVGGKLTMYGTTASNTSRENWDITGSWPTSTDGSRKGRVIFNVWDTAARECIRLEAKGSLSEIALHGAISAGTSVLIRNPSASQLSLGLRGASGQTQRIFEIQDDGGTPYWFHDYRGRPYTSDNAPSVSAGSGDSGATVSLINGGDTDLNGVIEYVGNSASSNSDIVIFSFSNAWDSPPKTVILTPANENAAALEYAYSCWVWVTNITTTDFQIVCGSNGMPSSIPIQWYYQVLG